jgi:4-hydroxy-tetrahydrodipicolinate synthase
LKKSEAGKAERLSGLFAALLTPLTPQGGIDYDVSDALVDFLVQSGVDGICVGGCTGEYPHFTLSDRMKIISRTAGRLRGRAQLLTSIGASNLKDSLTLGAFAAEQGSRAVLLPTPHFFRYDQDDLEVFVQRVSRALTVPCLFYHIPAFSNSLVFERIVKLLKTEENLVGIKDSSGIRESLWALSRKRGKENWALMVGDDSLFYEGLQAGWEGVVSGVACVCPELLVGLLRNWRASRKEAVEQHQLLLLELIAQMDRFPTPWAIRFGLEMRGFAVGEVPLPLSAARENQKHSFQAWFSDWWSLHSTELEESKRRAGQ